MTLFVNEKEIILFDGATVSDALRKYNDSAVNKVKKGNAYVLDTYGNNIGLSGALTEGSRLFLRDKK